MTLSKLMTRLESGIFTALAQGKSRLRAAGTDVIDLSVGTPNIPPTHAIKQAIAQAAMADKNYVYAIEDLPELKQAASQWYSRRYGVSIDPSAEVCAVLGTQEGLAHCCLPLINPGDTVILPDPCYPAFRAGAQLAGADIFFVPQRPENGFVIDFADIPPDDAQKAKLMIASYPNNPTTAVAPPSFYDDLIAFAHKYDIFVIHDNAYSELTFDGLTVGSFLAHDGAKEIGAEFNSLSKTYGLAGARLGFCLGNSDYIAALSRLKSNTDFGIFLPVQKAGIAAMNSDSSIVADTALQYQSRRDVLISALGNAGWHIPAPKATMFVWAKVPPGFGSDVDFYQQLARQTGVIVVPGSAFGSSGSGYVRMALVQSEDRICEAAERIRGFLG